MKRVAIVVSSPLTVRAFLVDQIDALCRTYETWVIANIESPEELSFLPEAVNVLSARIERKVVPLNDIEAFIDLARTFRRHRFDLVHSITPKAGLLAMTAASAVRVPVRIHTFTGQVWATRKGLARRILKATDKLTATLATAVLVDSGSQRDFLMKEGVVTAEQSRVLAGGSLSGVDTNRFKPDPAARTAVRRQLGLVESDCLFLFVGRLNRDKGILTLAEAFRLISRDRADCHLVFVGADEEELSSLPLLAHLPRTSFAGPTLATEQFLAAADVICLPSRREGFGIVLVEAASSGVPAVASNIYGITDAVADGITGLLHRPDDVDDLRACMSRMASDSALRNQLGLAGRERAIALFQQRFLTAALLDTYEDLLREPRSLP